MGYDTETGEVEEINLATLAEGAAVEQVNDALRSAWANISDLNTKAGDKRRVTLDIVLQSNEDRTQVVVTFRVVTKFASDKPGMAIVELCRARGGEIVAAELRSRQMQLRGTDEQMPADVTPIKREVVR